MANSKSTETILKPAALPAAPGHQESVSRLLYSIVLAVWVFYAYLNVTTPSNNTASQFNISHTTLLLLRATIVLPYLLIWLITTNAFRKVYRYSLSISGSHEARAFRQLAFGIAALLFGLILTALLGAIRGFTHSESTERMILTVFINYCYVVPPLVAFGLFLAASRKLVHRLQPAKNLGIFIVVGTLLTIFALGWLDLIFSNPTRNENVGSVTATYYLRDSLIIMTIAIPSFITWIFGVLTIINFKHYQEVVKGVLYRKSLHSFVWGFAGVILNIIFFQELISIGGGKLLGFGLRGILIVIYAYLLLQGISFYMIARGANHLQKLESV